MVASLICLPLDYNSVANLAKVFLSCLLLTDFFCHFIDISYKFRNFAPIFLMLIASINMCYRICMVHHINRKGASSTTDGTPFVIPETT